MAFPTWLPGAVNFLRWVRGLFVMSKASFGPPDNGASETGLNHIHIPVSVKANFFGSEPILGAEPWAQLSDGTSTHTIKLLWRNENDSNAPFPNIDLRAGRTYYIPIVARSTRSGLPLSGRVVTVIPMELYSAWVLSAGVPRITDGNHYFTFTGLTNLNDARVYSLRLEIRASNGKIALVKNYCLYVPKKAESNERFRLTDNDD